MRDFLRALRARLPDERIQTDEPMAPHTTFRVGGPADVFVLPATEAELIWALSLAAELCVPALVIGNGSNLLVRDGGIRGAVVSTLNIDDVRVEGNRLIASAGAALSRVSNAAMKAGLAGLEFASGIPGTLGGAVAMNAGAYGGEIAKTLSGGKVYVDGQVKAYSADDFAFGYRESAVQKNGGIVLSAEFALERDDPGAIAARMREMNARRREKQPLELPSAGSTFKRPAGQFAGTLIERAGLKGYSIGGARVSEKHAGFIVNAGGATARDILSLIAHVQMAVREMCGAVLEPEVRIVGEEN